MTGNRLWSITLADVCGHPESRSSECRADPAQATPPPRGSLRRKNHSQRMPLGSASQLFRAFSFSFYLYCTILANVSATRLAPPTRAPSICSWAINSLMLSGFTEPPYRMRVFCAVSAPQQCASS